MKTYIVEY